MLESTLCSVVNLLAICKSYYENWSTTNDQRPRVSSLWLGATLTLSGLNRNFTERGGNIPYHSYGQRHLCEKGSSTGGLLPITTIVILPTNYFQGVGKRCDNCRTRWTQQKLYDCALSPICLARGLCDKSKTNT